MLVPVDVPEAAAADMSVDPPTVSAGRRLRRAAVPYLYLLPAIVGLAVWIYWPLIQTVQLSFFSWNLLPTTPKVGVGIANYRHVLGLPQLTSAIAVTLLFVGGLLLFAVLVPLMVGVLTQHVGARGRAVYRALLFVPVLISPVAAGAIWSFLLAPNGGLVNEVTGWFGFGPSNWLQQPGSARASIVVISGWKTAGFAILIVAAGLATISPEYYEAAAVDGVSRWQQFRRLTLPLLSPSILFLTIMAILLSSQIVFPLLNSLTQGGPAGATTDIYYLLYQFGFSSFDVGTASATAVLFFFVFGVVALVCVKLLDRYSFHDQ